MKKKEYIAPDMEEVVVMTAGMLASSVLDPEVDQPDVLPSTDPMDIIGGEFSAPPFKMLLN